METDTGNHKLVKVLADSTNKRVLLAIFAFGLALLVTIYVISAFAIPVTFFYINGLENCPDDISSFNGFCHSFLLKDQNVWQSYLSGFDKKNTFFVVTGTLEREEGSSNVEMDLELDFRAVVMPVDEQGYPIEKDPDAKHTRQHKFKIHCDADSTLCQETGFILYPRTDHKNYRIRIELDIDTSYRSIIKGVRFLAKTQNPAYTSFLLGVRYTCLIISLAFSILYFLFYKKIKPEYKTFEHKYILVLSIALLFFNDPIYAATVLQASTFLAILSALFVVTFISALIFFWIVMVQRIHKEEIRVSTQMVNWINIILGVASFLILCAIVFISSIVTRFDPGYHIDSEYPLAYEIMMIIVVCVFAMLLLLFFFNSYKIYKNWNKLIPRHKFFFLFSFYFVVTLFFVIITGLYHSVDFNGVRVLMLFVLFTFYVVVLQLMWRFDKGPVKHFIDVKNYQGSKVKRPAGEEKKDLGMNYFDKDCEVEITKTGGFRRRDDSIITLEAENEPRISRSVDFETAQFPDSKEKSNLQDKISFNQFQTRPATQSITRELEVISEVNFIDEKLQSMRTVNVEGKISFKNDGFEFKNSEDEEQISENPRETEPEEVQEDEEEEGTKLKFGYQEFRDVDEEEEEQKYEFGAFNESHEEDNNKLN